jgi:hypothetical protein
MENDNVSKLSLVKIGILVTEAKRKKTTNSLRQKNRMGIKPKWAHGYKKQPVANWAEPSSLEVVISTRSFLF